MNNKRFIKYTSGMTALALSLSLSMGGCSTAKTSFEYAENENGEVIVEEDSYIEYEYLNNYYVLELYNTVTKQNELYITYKVHLSRRYSSDSNEYRNIFNNYTIFYTDGNTIYNGLEYVKETSLLPYITGYYTLKNRYTYEDMEKLYEIIKENYKFENDKALRRKLTINNRI